jgi:hypothetical protein
MLLFSLANPVLVSPVDFPDASLTDAPILFELPGFSFD